MRYSLSLPKSSAQGWGRFCHEHKNHEVRIPKHKIRYSHSPFPTEVIPGMCRCKPRKTSREGEGKKEKKKKVQRKPGATSSAQTPGVPAWCIRQLQNSSRPS
ncbi:hypothetical protein CDAR_556881 [Caerostris darwini]|uniref:Uncharacterized protein n=1 Tax=Caerostris darwini TaxID=1538125 RepID=A0AAV4QJW9_9ARAC|nr:hypothetical protein CDAR_556881 [Caerostris darwini]